MGGRKATASYKASWSRGTRQKPKDMHRAKLALAVLCSQAHTRGLRAPSRGLHKVDRPQTQGHSAQAVFLCPGIWP